MVRHALAASDKEARRNHILSTALDLFVQDTRRLPAVALIAERSGLAKGTVYLYFTSKEQVFVALLSREWTSLLFLVGTVFKEQDTPGAVKISNFVDRFVGYLTKHPYFLRLDSLGYALLEAKLSKEELWAFKGQFVGHLMQAGDSIDDALTLPHGRGLSLLTRSYALTRGLWQLADYAEEDEKYLSPADHPFAKIDFDRDIRESLTEYWRGAMH